ncbi:MAG: hypothetical protein HYS78_02340, partial [Parcubacteria group bacterium]|nr:hypothetical protein [Parcubacteria group bacterium]
SLFAVALGFIFSAYVLSVSAGNYLTYPSGILTLEGIEPCKDAAECDAICDSRGASPITCFFFYGDEGLASQKADYFKKIVGRAERALQKLITEGKPGGSLTEEKFKKYYLEQSIADGYLRSLAEPSNSLLSKEGIRNSLIQNGWPPEDVDQAFAAVEQMNEEELREASKLFSVEGIYLNNGVGIDGQYQLKNIIRIGKALEQAARKKIKPPSVCGYGLMCFGECSPDNLDLSPECKNFLTETGYADDRTVALAQLIAAKSTDDVGGGPGGCWDLVGCEIYCDAEENRDECIEFADKNDLAVEIPDDKKAVFAAIEKGDGPGGCKDEASCRNYCESIDNLEECVNFVEKFNLADDEELKEIRQMASVKKAGVAFPGNCKTKESCLAYCDNSANAVECMEFALKAGFIPKEDIEAVSKIIPYLKSGGKLPGGCTTKESCETYCDNDSHAVECVDFAANAGFMSKEDAEIVKKTGGRGPGNCKSREACDNYCKSETHIDECVDFAVKAGFISKEDAEDAKKYKITSGPGECKNKAECEAFCVLPENQDTCFNFAKKHGMISEEDLKNIEKYRNQEPPDFSQVNPKWLACMEKEMGSDVFGRFKAGRLGRSDVSAVTGAQKKCESEMGQDIRKEMEVCLGKTTCSEFNNCMDALQQSGGKQQGGQQTPDPKVDAKMKACKDEIQKEKMSACLAKSCGEFEACLKSLEQSGGQGGQQQGEGTPDPAVSAKFQTCQQEKINACLVKSCDEFQACLNSLGAGGGEQQGGASNPAVQAKFMSCFPPPSSGGGPPNSFMENSYFGAISKYLFR